MANRIELVTIGDELLLGFTVDTNGAHLARELATVGIEIVRRSTVRDNADDIAGAVADALDRAGAVVTTGGLGPTSDDQTKAAVAQLFKRGMYLDAEHLAWMEERWRSRFKRALPEANRSQAMLPVGSRKLVNRHGSAPGVWLEDERGRWVAMLPGVPREMRGMLADTLMPMLRERLTSDTVVRSRTLRTTGIAESLLADWIGPIERELEGIDIAYLPGLDGVDLRLTSRGRAPADANAALSRAVQRLAERVGVAGYGEDDVDLAAVLLDLCRARQLTVAIAESCTGGLVGARLTAVPGSSDVVIGAIVAYANAVKVSALGVQESTLREHGAVSDEVVREMASGARRSLNASVGLAVTGIAGPSGGTVEKPVGSVWIAIDTDAGVRTAGLRLWGDRDEIRRRAAQAVLDLARRMLLRAEHGEPPSGASADVQPESAPRAPAGPAV